MISCPSSVGLTGWHLQSNMVTSSSYSSFCIRDDRVDCVMPHDSAALAKWRYLTQDKVVQAMEASTGAENILMDVITNDDRVTVIS